MRAAAGDPWAQLTLLAVLGVAFCSAAWLVAGALTLYHGVAQGRLLLHDYSDSFPARFRRVTPVAFGLFFFSVLWASGIGPLVVLALVGVALTPYMNLRARLAFGIAVFVGCLLPVTVERLASWTGPGSDSAWTIYRVLRGDAGADLSAAIGSDPGLASARGRYLGAQVARRNGDAAVAAVAMDQVLGSADGLPPGLAENERGNLAFLAGDLDRAESLYRKAAAADSGDPVPWLNQHLVHLKRLDLDAADSSLARARERDAGMTKGFEALRSADPEVLYPVAHPVPRGWVAAATASSEVVPPAWVAILSRTLFLPGSLVRPEYVGVFALLVALVAGRGATGRRSRPCPSCGFVVCPRCSRRVKGSLLCSACWSAANEAEVDAAERERRELSGKRWARRLSVGRRLGHVVLPGFVDYLGAAPVRGGFLALVWVGGVGIALVALAFPLPWFAWGGPRMHWAPGVAVVGVAHLLGAWRALRCGGEG